MAETGGSDRQPGEYDGAMVSAHAEGSFVAPSEFDVPLPDGSVGADEVELEALYGTDVWESDLGSLAEDVVTLREHQRQGLKQGFLGHLIGGEEIDRLRQEAERRGDYDRSVDLMWEVFAVEPERLLIAIFGSVDAGRAAFEAERKRQEPQEGEGLEPEPPVTVPLQEVVDLRGREH